MGDGYNVQDRREADAKNILEDDRVAEWKRSVMAKMVLVALTKMEMRHFQQPKTNSVQQK